jgi:hypothetical protein
MEEVIQSFNRKLKFCVTDFMRNTPEVKEKGFSLVAQLPKMAAGWVPLLFTISTQKLITMTLRSCPRSF